ncbi:MAG: hypothetical protein KBS85_03720 [Lachnospiraceae bacterium]|nr:hypothetical protein [Candidatus Merdinaster equi]
MKQTVEKKIVDEFKKTRYRYEALDKIVFDKLSSIIEDKNYFVMDIAHRVKEVDSLRQKVHKKTGKYSSIRDITDLCGYRIICYFGDTVDAIASSLAEYFVIDTENSIDKGKNLMATEFGYASLHYICSLPENDEYPSDLCNIPFEVQIRTVLQHAWAEIEHDLGYKSDFGVPRAIRREFSRVASLLEVADERFVGLRNGTNEYLMDVRTKIANGEANDLPLDQVTLKEYITRNKRYLRVVDEAKKILHVEVIASDISRFVIQLDYLGVKTLGDLVMMFRKNQSYLIGMIKEKVETMDLDIVTTSMILRYLCRAELVLGKYTKGQIYRFLLLSSKEDSAEKSANIISEISAKYWAEHAPASNPVEEII